MPQFEDYNDWYDPKTMTSEEGIRRLFPQSDPSGEAQSQPGNLPPSQLLSPPRDIPAQHEGLDIASRTPNMGLTIDTTSTKTGYDSQKPDTRVIDGIVRALGVAADIVNRNSNQTDRLDKQQEAKRKANVEERMMQTEQRKAQAEISSENLKKLQFIAAQKKNALEASGKIVVEAKSVFQQLAGSSPQDRIKATEAMIRKAADISPETVDIVRGMASMDPSELNVVNYLPFLDPKEAPSVMQNVAYMMKYGGVAGQKEVRPYVESHAATGVMSALLARAMEVKQKFGSQYGNKQIPLSVLRDYLRPEEGPLLDALFGSGGFKEKATAISDALVTLGFEAPGQATKVAEARAVKESPEEAATRAGAVSTAQRKAGLAPDVVAGELKKEAALTAARAAASQKIAEGKKLTREEANNRMNDLAKDIARLEMGQGIDPIELMQATLLAKDNSEIASRIKIGDPQVVEYSKRVIRNDMERLSREYGIPLPAYPKSPGASGAGKTPPNAKSVKDKFGIP